ncbi:MAG: hypothetical protein M3256_19730, partial [Actinomycetota bacterium]|nr:hypothetical protein [Actinomycetota bacterium]
MASSDRQLSARPWVWSATAVLGAVMVVAGVVMVTGLAWRRPGGRPQVGIERPLTAMNLETGPANNSPLVVEDPSEARFVVLANRLDAPDFGCALQLSGDGGNRWAPAEPVPRLPPGADKCYAPEVAF